MISILGGYTGKNEVYNDIKIGKYLIKYDNDTGPMDESFGEWWSVLDTESEETICECDTQEKAIHIAMKLSE